MPNSEPTNLPKKIKGDEQGTSIVEIVIVLLIIAIMTAVSIPYFLNYTKRYRTEDQAVKVMDLMREAGQLALTHRRIHRFEINTSTDQTTIRIVDEGAPGIAERVVKTVPLYETSTVRMDVLPSGVNFTGIPYPAFPTGTATSARFKSDGSVINTGGLPLSGTLVFWPPVDTPYLPGNLNPRNAGEIRAVSMSGASGAVRFFRYTGNTFQPWQ